MLDGVANMVKGALMGWGSASRGDTSRGARKN